jgi:two-component system sensor kinase FixL
VFIAPPLAEEAVALAALDAPRLRVRVQLDFDPTAGLVFTDRVQIQQVVMNLVRNALEAMDGETRRELRVEMVARDDAVEIRVVCIARFQPEIRRQTRKG